MIRNFHFGLMLATTLSVSLLSMLFLPTAGNAYTPEQQQACTGDAFRLCGSDIPDVDRVTACMIRNKSQLSPGCRAFFRPGPEPVAAAPAGRPMAIRPVTSRKSSSAKSSSAKSLRPKSTGAKSSGNKAKPRKPAKPTTT
jgi:hypothetical protein